MCGDLGVKCLDDLAHVTEQDIYDELSTCVKDKLTLAETQKLGTQFTCFTGTKVQILTQKALLGAMMQAGADPQDVQGLQDLRDDDSQPGDAANRNHRPKPPPALPSLPSLPLPANDKPQRCTQVYLLYWYKSTNTDAGVLTSASSTHLDCRRVEEGKAKSAVRSGEAGSHAAEHLLDVWQYAAACQHEAPNMLAAAASAGESNEVY